MTHKQRYPNAPWLYDDTTGDIVGVKDPDGSELLFQRAANYGYFCDLSDQSDGINTPNAIEFDTTVIGQGISIDSATKITFARGGKFKFTLTAQVENSDSQDHNFYLWGKLNGTNIPNSLTRFTVPSSHGSSNGALVVERSYFGVLSAGQYIEVMWMTDNAAVTLQHTAAQVGPPALPATPSVTLIVTEVAT